jgi:hypothetical protein
MHALFIHCIIDCSISHNRSIRSGEASYVFLQAVIIDYGCESQLHIHYKKVHLSIISHNIYIELPKFFPSLALKKPYYGFCVQLLFLSTFFWQDKHVLVLWKMMNASILVRTHTQRKGIDQNKIGRSLNSKSRLGLCIDFQGLGCLCKLMCVKLKNFYL